MRLHFIAGFNCLFSGSVPLAKPTLCKLYEGETDVES
jgi:hypothetical protein